MKRNHFSGQTVREAEKLINNSLLTCWEACGFTIQSSFYQQIVGKVDVLETKSSYKKPGAVWL